jgi:hypothetical protein
MTHSVRVDRLPDDFRIPADLQDRLVFEPQSGRLVHHGFMSKEEYDRLVGLSGDWSFIRKLEDLFQQCTYEDDAPRPSGLRRLFAAFSGAK